MGLKKWVNIMMSAAHTLFLKNGDTSMKREEQGGSVCVCVCVCVCLGREGEEEEEKKEEILPLKGTKSKDSSVVIGKH